MDSSEDTHNSDSEINDQLNIISSTSGVEVQPINQTIATTSVSNSIDSAIDHKISSSLDNSSSTSGIEVTKSNEFTLINVQEQNKTESFQLVEIPKLVPVKQIIATTSVINSSKINEKNLKAHNINNSLEQKKIENFKIIDNNVEIPVQRAVPLAKVIQNTFLINAPRKNENNIEPHNSRCGLGGSLDNNNSTRGIEVSKLNKSTSTKVQEQNKTVHFKTVDNNDVKISNQQNPLKKVIATTYVINAPKKNENIYIRPNNYPLNLEKIAVPKTVLSNVKLIPPTSSSQIKKPQTISLIPGTGLVKPTNTTIITRLQPKFSGFTNKCVPTLKHGFKIVSSSEPKSKMFLLPKGVNYIIKTLNKEEVNNQSLPSFSSTSTMLKTLNKEEVNNQSLPSSSSTSTMLKTLNKEEVKNQSLPSFSSTSTTLKTLNKVEVDNQSMPNFSCTSTLKPLNKGEVNNQSLPSFSSTSTTLKPLNKGEVNNQSLPSFSSTSTTLKTLNKVEVKKQSLPSFSSTSTMLKPSNKEEIKNQLLPSLSSTSTMLKPLNSIIPITVAEKFNTIEKPKIQNRNSKFVVRWKEFQNQRYQVLPNEKTIINENNRHLFESNKHFELLFPRSSKSFIRNQKRSLKSHTDTPKSKVIKITDTSESNHVQQKIEQTFRTSALNKIKNSTDFGGTSGKKKCIPHTITSKDVIDNNTNLVIENKKTKLNTELCTPSGFIQLSSRPESSILKTYGQSLTVTKYGNFSNNELSTVRLVPYGSINQSQTKGDGKQLFIKILKNNGSTSNGTIATVTTDKIMKVIPTKVYAPQNTKIAAKENQKKILLSKPKTIKLFLPKDTKKEEQTPGPCENVFIHCQYEYCRALVSESEMIDKMYCSLVCKKLDTKLRLATEKTVVIAQPQEESQKKPVIDRKLLLAKLKSRINKRKQSLSTLGKENEAQPIDLGKVVQPDNDACQMPPPIPITVKRSFQKSEKKRKSSRPTTFIENHKQENAKILSYLEHTNYIPAPKKLFDDPFPSDCNPFKVGQRLEGIDPEHEALFCVMTVVEVVGYRIKLHFDGYQDKYDFWVNANCPDLFFPRWCEQNSRTLQPPKNYNRKFSWTDYLRLPGVTPAPKWNFPCAIYIVNREIEHLFRIGAKLEALDKLTRTLPQQLICVATVADILGNRIRIHFDGWTDDFDYWTDITSTNIHPVGWCDKNGRTLCPPHGYDNCRGKKPFSWPTYLKETNSEPVPEDAFARRPLREFTNSMAIEVVDIANPSLVRIAKVVDVKGDELKILYDGFDSIYAYWIEDDSPNIHPVGWCLKTNHPIELFKVSAELWSCRVPGCNGKGNSNSSKNTHVFAKDCPYEFESWNKSISRTTHTPDRLKPDDIPVSVARSSKPMIIRRENKKKQKSKLNKMKSYNLNKPKIRRVNNKLKKNFNKKIPSGRSKTVYKRVIEAMDDLEMIKGDNDYTSYGYGSFKQPRLNVWVRHNVLQGIPLFNISDVRKWSVEEVATFVEKIVSNNYTDNDPSELIKISKPFINQEIDGDVFLMLTKEDLTNKLNIPLGPALKLHNVIVVLRQRTSAYDIANELIRKK
ncbi:uncharacterized protein LOC111033751 [Myzus persicae]|uniref:uncharacterized protein LOC111033751 n=1 Tax=Myzus persicae TaxID=13164 RepID=UPI000B930915|nr:uncharacterized protein LOC111033751 [Myzus persicae]XP_022170348.1 uncharacterized protein LOC111033751 [Myzus persicae]